MYFTGAAVNFLGAVALGAPVTIRYVKQAVYRVQISLQNTGHRGLC